VAFPAAFQLVGAMNPCRRGCRGFDACACTPADRGRYLGRLSGPLLDRFDVRVSVPPVPYRDLGPEGPAGEPSALIRERVVTARARQRDRFGRSRLPVNGRMTARQMTRHCRLEREGRRLMGEAVDRLGLSARAHDRVLRVARTIADLAGHEDIATGDLLEALQYRGVEGWEGR
jgi:magnesium chelatase family protein